MRRQTWIVSVFSVITHTDEYIGEDHRKQAILEGLLRTQQRAADIDGDGL